MLNICAYFAPDEIDSGIFVRNYELLPKPLNRDAVDEINFDAVISELTSYSLLSKKDDKLYMHRSLQEVIRRSLIENQEFIECAFEIILNEFSFEYGNIESHNAFLHIAPHVISITEQALECLKDEDKQLSIAKLYNDMGNGFFYIGSFQQSLIWHQKALKIREKALGMEHPDTATNYSNMAVVYKAQGDYGKALALYEKALLIREKALGMEHPDTATIYSNMAGVYHDQGDYGKALALYEKALLIREKVLGMEHPDTAMTYGNMAVVYNDQGDYGNALELYEKALLIREKVLGMEHPDTAMTYGNIATLYNDQGDYGKALALHEKALLVFEKALGMEHPDTAMTYSNMAVVYNDQGDYGKALALHERALLIREKVLGMKHPDTAMTYSNMAIVYHNQGDYEKALELYEKAISIFKDKLGENHPYTITVHNNLLSLKKNNNYNCKEGLEYSATHGEEYDDDEIESLKEDLSDFGKETEEIFTEFQKWTDEKTGTIEEEAEKILSWHKSMELMLNVTEAGDGRLIAFLLLASLILSKTGEASPVYAAEKYVTRSEFLEMVVRELGLRTERLSNQPYIDAVLSSGIVTKSTFSGKYDAALTRGDAAVVLVRADEYLNGVTVSDETVQMVIDKRISDIDKVGKARQAFVAKCYYLGYIVGSSNGEYSTDRKFNPLGKFTKATAEILISRIKNKDKREVITKDGQVTRTTNLPSNADMYPYILASYPNEYYDWEFHFMKVERGGKPLYGTSEMVNLVNYATPKDAVKYFELKGYYDRILKAMPVWEDYISRYLCAVFNVDYRTIKNDKEWYQTVLETAYQYGVELGQPQIERRMNEYIYWMIQNKTVIECDKFAFDMSTLYVDHGSKYIRVYVHYRINSALKTKQNDSANENGISALAFTMHNWGTYDNVVLGEWRNGYYDINVDEFEFNNFGIYEAVFSDYFYNVKVAVNIALADGTTTVWEGNHQVVYVAADGRKVVKFELRSSDNTVRFIGEHSKSSATISYWTTGYNISLYLIPNGKVSAFDQKKVKMLNLVGQPEDYIVGDHITTYYNLDYNKLVQVMIELLKEKHNNDISKVNQDLVLESGLPVFNGATAEYSLPSAYRGEVTANGKKYEYGEQAGYTYTGGKSSAVIVNGYILKTEHKENEDAVLKVMFKEKEPEPTPVPDPTSGFEEHQTLLPAIDYMRPKASAIEEAKLSNYALPSGSLLLKPSGYQVPAVSYQAYGTTPNHIVEPANAKGPITLPSSPHSGSSTPYENFQSTVEGMIKEIQVKNDSFIFDGKKVLDNAVKDKKAPDIVSSYIKEPVAISNNVLYKSGNIIDAAKLNGTYESTGTMKYTKATGHNSSRGDSQSASIYDINPVLIHTPVYCLGQLINDNKKYVQLVDPDNSCVPIVLDAESHSSDFTVRISNYGYHSGRKAGAIMDEKECLDREYDLLSQELDDIMGKVKDEQDVQRIRNIVNRMEELHPENESEYKSTEYYWERFKERHLRDALEMAELIRSQEREVKQKEKIRKKATMHYIRFAAVLILILTAVNTTTVVFAGFNIFAPIISWTENIFNKKSKANSELRKDYDKEINNCLNLEEVEESLGIQLFKPDAKELGYIENNFSVDDLTGMIFIGINYDFNGTEIQYGVTVFLSPQSYTNSVEKTDEEIEIHVIDNIDFYIIKNVYWYIVSWQDADIDYVASGFEDRDSAKAFIKSLRK
ncbi:tetratricopeptide repeat protein [Holotrichia oblita]|nr:tetratricopeptide repeat protein [Holotrichia oblita]